MHHTLYLISQSYLGTRKMARLRQALDSFTDGPADLIRLEREGEGLWAALDRVAQSGAQQVTLRPLGLPAADSLLAWITGAVGEWVSKQGPGAPEVWITDDLSDQQEVLAIIGGSQPERRRITPCPQGALGKGWDRPPAHRHHILVCTGPRCHLRDAPDLLGLMKAEIARAGISNGCLVSSAGCLFPCNSGPVVVLYPGGQWFRLPDAKAINAFVSRVLVDGQRLEEYETFQTGPPQYAH